MELLKYILSFQSSGDINHDLYEGMAQAYFKYFFLLSVV